MAPEPITLSAVGLDLSPRVVRSNTVAGSPAAAAETTIATITIPANVTITQGVELLAWCAFTVGTSGTGCNLKIHHTDASGATLAATGLVTATATNLMTLSAHGTDALAVLPGQVYIATLTVANGAAISTVSAVYLRALVI